MKEENKTKCLVKYNYPSRPEKNLELRKEKFVELITNLIEIVISKKEQKPYLYSVSIEPELARDNSSLKNKIYRYIEPQLNKIFQSAYFFSGDNLHAFSSNPQSGIIIPVTVENKEFKVNLKLTGPLEMKNIDNLNGENQKIKSTVEKLIKSIMLKNKNTIKFGDRNTVVKIGPKNCFENNEKEEVYKGYYTSCQITESGLYLLALNVNRHVKNITAYQAMKEIRQRYNYTQESVARNEIEKFFKMHKTVLTTYGSILRAYRVASIDFDANPKNTSVNIKEKDKITTITLMDYYKNQYNIIIQDQNQPLIIAENKTQKKSNKNKNSKDSKDSNEKNNNSQNNQNEIKIYLIPELLYITGNTQEMDDKNKRGKPNKIVSNPNIKMQEIFSIKELMTSNSNKTYKSRDGKILQSKSPAQLSEEWGISLGNNLRIKGRLLPQPTLIYGRDKKVFPKNGRFRSEVLLRGEIFNRDNFIYVYDENDRSNIKSFLSQLFDKARSKEIQIGSRFDEIRGISVKGNSGWENIRRTLDIIKQHARGIKMAFVFLSNNLEKHYSQLKTFFTNETQFPTQFAVSKKFQDAKKAGSIMFNIVEQINVKMGGLNFTIDFYSDNLLNRKKVYMIVGLESRTSSRGVDYVMTSTTNRDLNQIITSVESVQNNTEQKEKAIFHLLETSLKELQKGGAPHPPDYIILYRQGGNYVQNLKLAESEVPFFTGYLNNRFKNHKIKFIYVCCNLKSEFKFFEINQKNYSNPMSGVVVDEGITQKDKYEYYLQPQSVNQGSATSCHYQVLYEDKDEGNVEDNMKLEQLEKLGFYLSFYYWTWAGAIRVPNVLKFATTAMEFFSKHLNGNLQKENKQFITPEYI